MPGLPGLDGERVSSFAHLWLRPLLSITTSDWVSSLLQGYKGSKGDMGMPGSSGEKGATGLPGLPVRPGTSSTFRTPGPGA